MKKKKLSPIAEVVKKDIQEFEKEHGNVKYVEGVMKKFGLKERKIKVKQVTYE